jgi:hypothetical protein
MSTIRNNRNRNIYDTPRSEEEEEEEAVPGGGFGGTW